jgi:hypothetical protein
MSAIIAARVPDMEALTAAAREHYGPDAQLDGLVELAPRRFGFDVLAGAERHEDRGEVFRAGVRQPTGRCFALEVEQRVDVARGVGEHRPREAHARPRGGELAGDPLHLVWTPASRIELDDPHPSHPREEVKTGSIEGSKGREDGAGLDPLG